MSDDRETFEQDRLAQGSGDTPGRGLLAEDASVDVVNAENLLAELDRSFGECPGRATIPPLTVLPQLIGSDLWPVIMARSEGRPRFLTPDEATAVVREFSGAPTADEVGQIFGELPKGPTDADQLAAMRAEQDFLMEHGVIHAYPALSLPEHEPAHDRRERASARNEDNTGRVEGVDR